MNRSYWWLLGAALLAGPFYPDLQLVWAGRWGIFLLACLGLSFKWLPSQWKLLRVGLVYGAILAAIAAFYPPRLADSELFVLLTRGSLATFAAWLGFFFFLSGTNGGDRQILKGVLAVMGTVVAGLSIYARFHDWSMPVFQNRSIAATFIALSLPLTSWWGFASLAVWLIPSATGKLVWCLGVYPLLRPCWRKVVWVALPIAFFFLLPYDSGRMEMWGRFLKHFGETGWHRDFGMGPGTASVWLPLWQAGDLKEPAGIDMWMWLHNDWLELLIEYGCFGFSIFLVCAYTLWRGADRFIQTRLLQFGCAMLTQFPLHWAPTALIGWVLVADRLAAPKQTKEIQEA